MPNIEDHIIEMKARSKRFGWTLVLLMVIVICLECLRMFVLDAKVHTLYTKIHALEARPQILSAYCGEDTAYPANVAEESDHGD